MILEDALALSPPKPDPFELLMGAVTDGHHWYHATEYWGTERMSHRSRCLG